MARKKEFNIREKIAMIVLVVIGVSIFAFNMAYKSVIRFKQINTEIVNNERKLFELTAILRTANKLNSEYETIASRYRQQHDYDSLLQDISNIARVSGANILNIKPTLVNEDKKLKTYVIKIQSQDDVSTFTYFLRALMEELKTIGVERVQIEAQGKDELPLISLFIKTAVFK